MRARHVSTLRLALSVIVCLVFAAGTAAGTTRTGASIAAAAQRFLTFYSGVFALVALTAAVAAGLVATDRLIMSAGGRIVAQAVHRALAFVAVAFLAIHILLEVMVGKSQAIDSVVPFLAHGRTFYIGIGTVASDLLVLVAATGIARRRFAEGNRPLAWKLLHGTAYAAWPLSIVHGLVAGRQPKPYVSWSYGACMIAVGLALMIRSVVTVRPRQETARAWPGDPDSPLRAAAAAAQAYFLQAQQAPLAIAAQAGLLPGATTTPPQGIPVPTPPQGIPAQTPPHGVPVPTPPHGVPAHTPGHGMAATPGVQGPPSPASGLPLHPSMLAQYVDPQAYRPVTRMQASASQYPQASADGYPPATPDGPAQTPAEGFAAAAAPHGIGAHTPAEWPRDPTPAEGMPALPARTSLPYQVQSLHQASSQDTPPRWAV